MKDYQVNLNKTQEEDVVIFCFVEFECSITYLTVTFNLEYQKRYYQEKEASILELYRAAH